VPSPPLPATAARAPGEAELITGVGELPGDSRGPEPGLGPQLQAEAVPEPEPETETEIEIETETETEMETGTEPQLEPEPEPPLGPMAEFDEAAVLAWLSAVPGLTAAQRLAARERMEEDEYDGADLAVAKPKRLLKLLKGSAAEGAVPLLLAARDAHLAASAEPAAAAAAVAPACQICFEAYRSAGGLCSNL
jgi:hypothetical protein